ncbi:MAG TPA: isochorismatase family protein [Fimbriimonas sp.]
MANIPADEGNVPKRIPHNPPMPRVHLTVQNSALVVVDLQPSFLKAVHEADRVLHRSIFLTRIANLMGIPVVATEQYPSRMGATDPRMVPHLGAARILGKMSFSCCGCPDFTGALGNRHQIVLVGAETHICVCLTANDLLQRGYQVVVCPDAVSSRTLEMHKLGMERIRDAGAVPSHTETVAYEWLKTAEHAAFKEALGIVKEMS